MVSPSLEGRQSGDNDRQVDLVVVLCCPSGSGLCPFSTTACKYNLPMHRSARAACLLHPMCFV